MPQTVPASFNERIQEMLQSYDVDRNMMAFIPGDYQDYGPVGPHRSEVLDDPYWIGPKGWLLESPLALAEPVPAKGALSVWTLEEEARERMVEVGLEKRPCLDCGREVTALETYNWPKDYNPTCDRCPPF